MSIRRIKRKIFRIFRFVNKLTKGFYWLFVGFVLLLGLTVFASSLNLWGLKIFSVMSGSMSPKIFSGSIVIIKPGSDYKTGDVIAYRPPAATYNSLQGSITHRITGIKEDGGNKFYITKGDNNPSPDSTAVSGDKVIGRALFSIPLLGYAAAFAKTPYGFASFVIIPALLIIISEARKIQKEITNLPGRRIYR